MVSKRRIAPEIKAQTDKRTPLAVCKHFEAVCCPEIEDWVRV
jgi:hypothetical protein